MFFNRRKSTAPADEILVSENRVFLRFGVSGTSASPAVISLAEPVSFNTADCTLAYTRHGQAHQIETFANANSARAALDNLWAAVTEHVQRRQRTRRIGIRFGLAAGAVVLFSLFIASIGTPAMPAGGLTPLPVDASLGGAKQAHAAPVQETDNSKRLALAGFAPGEKPMDFAIKIGAGEPTVWVFADPKCAACRQLEPMLDALSKDYTIAVFPVAFQPGSQQIAQRVMCAADRAQAWKLALQDKLTGGSDSCAAATGVDKLTALFVSQGMSGTPSIVAKDGRVRNSVGSLEELKAWLAASKA